MNAAKPIAEFKHLINRQLPSVYKQPVRFNHCFNRIILDWLFKDCWCNHLNKSKTALGQLTEQQLELAVARMQEWLGDHDLLVKDNDASLEYRKDFRESNINKVTIHNRQIQGVR